MSRDRINTVGDLMDFLARQPRNRKVVLEKDAEGNGCSPLADASVGMYVAMSTWSGEVYPTPEDLADDPMLAGDNAAPDGAVRVVVLGPVN